MYTHTRFVGMPYQNSGFLYQKRWKQSKLWRDKEKQFERKYHRGQGAMFSDLQRDRWSNRLWGDLGSTQPRLLCSHTRDCQRKRSGTTHVLGILQLFRYMIVLTLIYCKDSSKKTFISIWIVLNYIFSIHIPSMYRSMSQWLDQCRGYLFQSSKKDARMEWEW